MDVFACKVRCLNSGAEIERHVQATGEEHAIAELLSQDCLVIQIKRMEKGASLLPRLSLSETVYLARQLGVLLKSGLTVIESLECLTEQAPKITIARAIHKTKISIAEGMPLSTSLKTHFRQMDGGLIGIIKMGEQSGRLPEMLTNYAGSLDQVVRARKKILSSTAYPLFLIGTCIAVLMFFVLKLVPSFAEIYNGMHVPLPLLTTVVISVSHNVAFYAYYGSPGLLLILLALISYSLSPAGKSDLEQLKCRLPIFGGIYQCYLMSCFARMFSCLLASGIPILRALRMSADCTRSPNLRAGLIQAAEALENGDPLSLAFKRGKFLPPLFVRFAALGESSGTLDEMTRNAADVFDEQIEMDLRTYLPLIEPALIVIMGLIVGVLSVALFLPILKLSEMASGRPGF
jgi:type IV pilus assembly protein PilC